MCVVASIQWVCECGQAGVIRCHPNGGHWSSWSDYDWAATILKIDGDTVELLGVTAPFNREQLRAIFKVVRAEGYSKIIRRHTGGRVHITSVK